MLNDKQMSDYSKAMPHGDIKQIFTNIYFVTGTNITIYNDVALQHSRNMTIIRSDNDLTLINTVRLNEDGLKSLDTLGVVKNVVRIGAFHGRDDAFYLDHYHEKLWALSGMQDEKGHVTDVELIKDEAMPIKFSSLLNFETAKFPEGTIHVDQEGGIIITRDSIKNWLAPDEYFNPESAKLYQEQGFFGPASISKIWIDVTQVKPSDFEKLKQLHFCHLLSAHGVPLLNDAYQKVAYSIKKEFNV
jgi:hypothetical protein